MDIQNTIRYEYFEIKSNNNNLRIEINNDKLIFLLTTDISYYKYMKEYYYDEIVKELNLLEYKDINEIYNYLFKSKYQIINDGKKIIINDKEIELNEKLLTNDEIIRMLMIEIKNQNEKINELIKKNEDKDEKINNLEYKYNKIIDKLNELDNYKNEKKFKSKNENIIESKNENIIESKNGSIIESKNENIIVSKMKI